MTKPNMEAPLIPKPFMPPILYQLLWTLHHLPLPQLLITCLHVLVVSLEVSDLVLEQAGIRKASDFRMRWKKRQAISKIPLQQNHLLVRLGFTMAKFSNTSIAKEYNPLLQLLSAWQWGLSTLHHLVWQWWWDQSQAREFIWDSTQFLRIWGWAWGWTCDLWKGLLSKLTFDQVKLCSLPFLLFCQSYVNSAERTQGAIWLHRYFDLGYRGLLCQRMSVERIDLFV